MPFCMMVPLFYIFLQYENCMLSSTSAWSDNLCITGNELPMIQMIELQKMTLLPIVIHIMAPLPQMIARWSIKIYDPQKSTLLVVPVHHPIYWFCLYSNLTALKLFQLFCDHMDVSKSTYVCYSFPIYTTHIKSVSGKKTTFRTCKILIHTAHIK